MQKIQIDIQARIDVFIYQLKLLSAFGRQKAIFERKKIQQIGFFFNRKEFFFFCRVMVALNNFLVVSVIKCKRFLALEKKKMHYRKMCS